jgi:hypothetical protein
VAFPDSKFDRDANPEARAAWAIDRDDMDRLDERVREIMAGWRHPGRHFGNAGIQGLQAALGLRVEVRTPLQFNFDEGDRRIVELTEDQAFVLAYITKLHRAAIVGPAGSGKTLLAIQLAKRLAAGRTKPSSPVSTNGWPSTSVNRRVRIGTCTCSNSMTCA